MGWNPRVWGLRGKGREIPTKGPGARQGSAGSGCALCPGAPLTLRRRRPLAPPSYLSPTFSSPALLSAKAVQNPGLDCPTKSWSGFPGTWTHLLQQFSPLP